MRTFQLVNTRTENSLGWYDSEDEALREVAGDAARLGQTLGGASIALHRTSAAGDEVIACDLALVHLALARFPGQRSA